MSTNSQILSALTDATNDQHRLKMGRWRDYQARHLPDLKNMVCNFHAAVPNQQYPQVAPNDCCLDVHTSWAKCWTMPGHYSRNREWSFVFQVLGSTLAHREINSAEQFVPPRLELVRIPGLDLSDPESDPARHMIKYVLSNCLVIQSLIRTQSDIMAKMYTNPRG